MQVHPDIYLYKYISICVCVDIPPGQVRRPSGGISGLGVCIYIYIYIKIIMYMYMIYARVYVISGNVPPLVTEHDLFQQAGYSPGIRMMKTPQV